MNLANIGNIKKSRAALIKIVAENKAIMEPALSDPIPLPRAEPSSAILFPPVADTSATLTKNGVPNNA